MITSHTVKVVCDIVILITGPFNILIFIFNRLSDDQQEAIMDAFAHPLRFLSGR